jgi:hypothetical protein
MSLEKILHKIQAQIEDLKPSLELFGEQTIQPTVKDCEKLQEQVNGLMEYVAIYKYHKNDNELSPSFALHAKISEKNFKAEPPLPEIPVHAAKSAVQEFTPPADKEKKETGLSPITVSINDKFRFINELFAQNTPEYHIALEQLNNLRTWNETEIYLHSLKNLYGWKDHAEIVKHFYAIAKKRFS